MGLDETALSLSQLGSEFEDIAKKAVYAGAEIVADKMKENLKNVISPEATGDLEESMGIAPITVDKDGNLNTKIGFDGYDLKGVPNQLKARVLESGSSRQKKRPFVRPAINATKGKAQQKMNEVVQHEIQERMR